MISEDRCVVSCSVLQGGIITADQGLLKGHVLVVTTLFRRFLGRNGTCLLIGTSVLGLDLYRRKGVLASIGRAI